MRGLLEATPRQLLIAAGIILVSALVLAELALMLDRLVMARYDPAQLAEEVEDYLERQDDNDH